MAIIKPTLNLVASEYTPEILNVTRASGATRVNAAGLVERVSAGTLRYDYDPTTLAGKGWLIEEARTNLCLYSEDFTSWANPSATVTANAFTSPDGNTTADQLGFTSGAHPIYTTPTCVINTTYVFSAFVKQGTSSTTTDISMQCSDGVNDGYVYFNFDTGVASISPGQTNSISSVGSIVYPDGWTRIWGVRIAKGTGCRISFSPKTAGTYNFQAWGAQVEAGSFPTSYIPTTSAAVTRSLDSVSGTLPVTMNNNEGTLYCHIGGIPDTASEGTNQLFSISDGTGSNNIYFYIDGSGYLNGSIVDGGSNQGNIYENTATTDDEAEHRYVMVFETNDFKVARDGSIGTADSSSTMPDGLDTFHIGTSHGTTAPAKVHIKHIAVFSKAMSDANLTTIMTG